MKAICSICGVEFEKKVHNQKFCSNLCFKEYEKEYEKERRKTDKRKEYKKEYEKNCRKNLSDLCIKSYLNMFDAPKELIEAKREQIKLLRLIKQMS